MMLTKTMRKALILALCLAALLFGGECRVYGAGYADEYGEFDIQAQYEASGADRLAEALPDEALAGMERAGIDTGDVSTLTELNPAALLQSALSVAGEEVEAPLASLGLILTLLLLASVCKGGEHALDSSLSSSVNTVISLAVAITLVTPAVSVIEAAEDAVEASCRFSTSFSAVFVGILIANGQSLSAAGYSSFMMGATEAASLCVKEMVLPMLRIFLALSCISAVSDCVKIDAIIRLFEKYAKWLLSFLAVLISAALGISGLLSASADSVSARTAKFLISGSVPVVGGAVSDAYLSIKSGMTLLRNSVGAFGIVGVGTIFLPVIIRTALWHIVTGIGEALCETLGLDGVRNLMKSLSAALSLMLGVLVFSLFLLVIGGIIVIMQRSA